MNKVKKYRKYFNMVYNVILFIWLIVVYSIWLIPMIIQKSKNKKSN